MQIGKIFFSLKSTTIPSKNRGEFQFFLVKVQDDFGVDLVHPPDISPHRFPLEGLSHILNPSVSQSLHSPWIHPLCW